MSRQEVFQRYASKTLLVKVKEDKRRYINSIEKTPYCALSIIIKEKGKEEILAKYSYLFMEEVSKNDINQFIRSFLEDPEFRNQMATLEQGEKNYEKFNFVNEEGVNVQCRSQISYLNEKKVVYDSDFEVLKTYGLDKYSKMSMDTIEEIIDPQVIIMVKNRFNQSAKVLKICRWYLRGLKIELAIKKVLCDEQIAKRKKEDLDE